jgi:hypothetical protein
MDGLLRNSAGMVGDFWAGYRALRRENQAHHLPIAQSGWAAMVKPDQNESFLSPLSIVQPDSIRLTMRAA